MLIPMRFALLFIALFALPTVASAQQIYKCGSSYSQIPCPGGTLIDTQDARTQEQKKQTDAATAHAAKAATALEKSRIKQERADLAANTPRPSAATDPVSHKSAKTRAGNKKKSEPENFTARAPSEKPKPTAPLESRQ